MIGSKPIESKSSLPTGVSLRKLRRSRSCYNTRPTAMWGSPRRLSSNTTVCLRCVSPHLCHLPLICLAKEAVVDDGTSGVPGAIPPWNGWSGAGDVEGELIYANYGPCFDLARVSHLLQGRNPILMLSRRLTSRARSSSFGRPLLVLLFLTWSRYGAIFRANKVLFAMQRGAAAVLMFVDPADTGYLKGPVYPEGPWSTNSTTPRGTAWIGNGGAINSSLLPLPQLRSHHPWMALHARWSTYQPPESPLSPTRG